MLEQLIALKIPFAVVFSRSSFGEDSFVVIPETYRKKHNLRLFYMSSRPGLRERELTKQDRNDFKRLWPSVNWKAFPLGQYGVAYELPSLSFRRYHRQRGHAQEINRMGFR